MKKLILIVILYFIAFYSIAQSNIVYTKCFIGMTKQQIKDYWAVRVSESCMYEESDSVFKVLSYVCENKYGGIDYNKLTVDDPEFIAKFKNKKCIYHFIKMPPQNYSIAKAQLKQAGYTYDEKKDRFISSSKKVIFKISEINTIISSESEEHIRYVECMIYK